MKYLKFVFENEEVCGLADQNETLINEATATVIYSAIALENYVQENLEQFMSTGDSLADVYENIKNFAIQESVGIFHATSEVIKDPLVSDEVKLAIFEDAAAEASATPGPEGFSSKFSHLWSAAKKSGGEVIDSGNKNVIQPAVAGVASVAKSGSEHAANIGAGILSRLHNAKDAIELAVREHPAAAGSAVAAALAGAGVAGYKAYKNKHPK